MARTRYGVPPLSERGEAASARAAVQPARRVAAILVAHGMGQQIPFQTLDNVAEGLARLAPDRSAAARKPVARTIIVGEERLSRLELQVPVGADGDTRDVHIYEAYWAPITEGKVTLRDVVRFLLTAGLGGLRSGWKPFRRWLFDDYVEFPAPVRTVLYLTVALGVILSLIWLNVLIVTITAARAPFESHPAWLSDALLSDVTTVLNGLVVSFIAFGLCLGIASQRRVAWLRRAMGVPSIVLFVTALWATITAGCATAVIVAAHLGEPGRGPVFATFAAAARVEAFDRVVGGALLAILAIIAAVLGVYWLWTFLARLVSSLRPDADARAFTLAVLGAVLLIFGSAAGLAYVLAPAPLDASHALALGRRYVAWPLVIAAAAIVRSFLVEYLGDVVAYVQSQTLDRFSGLRQRIKDAVWKRAHAIYSLPDYDDIFLVGHSLGSVVMYDVLNRLLTEEARVPGAPAVKGRTKLLLTFGSPLDKTAFLFGAQGTGSEAREALAASVQPLISDPASRPEWVNVYSRWDIIGGSLNYYDLPGRAGTNRVKNRRDADATTLIAAHDEYWQNRAIFEEIARRL